MKLRSNEKILWWWNNYETTNLTSTGYIKINNGSLPPVRDSSYNLPSSISPMHTRQEYFLVTIVKLG